MVRRLALGSPYSKPSTAEDILPHPTSQWRFDGLHLLSISRGAHPMQRGYRTS